MNVRMRPGAGLLVDENTFLNWVARAAAGDLIAYHRGVLAIDRLPHGSGLGDADRRQLDRVANTVLALAKAGRGYVLQRRHGRDDYSYLFVFRSPLSGRGARLQAALESAS